MTIEKRSEEEEREKREEEEKRKRTRGYTRNTFCVRRHGTIWRRLYFSISKLKRSRFLRSQGILYNVYR